MIDTIIVNWRTPELAAKAARSVLGEPQTNRVIVVENGSGDDSFELLSADLTDPRVEIIQLDDNRGFGGGNNAAVAQSTAEFIFLLNSDAYVEAGAFALLLERMRDPEIGLVTPAIYGPSGTDIQQETFGLFPTPARVLSGSYRKPVTGDPEWVSAVAVLARRSEFQELGGFDEHLFMYLEDVDLCRRYAQRGMKVMRVPEAKAIHLGGGSRQSSAEQKRQFRKSLDYYLRKHGSGPIPRFLVRAARSVYQALRG